MTTIEEPIQRRRKDDKLLETLAGGSLVKAIGGAAAIVLSILGLARVYPYISLSIATIAVGVALLFEGGAIAAKYQRLLPATRPDQPGEGPGLQARTIELGGGMTSEFVGGAAGIVLGIVGLVGIAPFTLSAVAAIVFGSALAIGSGVPSRLAAVSTGRFDEGSRLAEAMREAASVASGTQVMVGVASIVLGILALKGVQPAWVLTLVALLTLGFSTLLSGTAVSGKMMALFKR